MRFRLLTSSGLRPHLATLRYGEGPVADAKIIDDPVTGGGAGPRPNLAGFTGIPMEEH